MIARLHRCSYCVNFDFFFMHKMLSNVYATVYFTCADDGIGRFDRSSFSGCVATPSVPTRWMATSAWWVGLVPSRWRSQAPPDTTGIRQGGIGYRQELLSSTTAVEYRRQWRKQKTITTERAHACRESYQSDCSAFAGCTRIRGRASM